MLVLSRDLERIGGEAKIVAYHDGERVVDAFFVTTAPVRGFEKLVLGKSPLFVIEAVMRICGICHAAHAIAAVEAFEDALGIAPPANGRILREAIGLINRVQSHILHLMLMLPDLVPREHLKKAVIDVVGLLNRVNDVMMRIGGAPTHPPNIAIGGVAREIPESSLNEALRTLQEVYKVWKGVREFVESMQCESPRAELLRKIEAPSVEFIASHLFYGDRYNIRVDAVKVVRYEEYRKSFTERVPENHISTTSLVALYNDRVVEAGPRARLRTYREFGDNTLMGIQLARMSEVDLALFRISELLEQVTPSGPVRTMSVTFRRGRGVGVYEAPRGTLIHRVELDDEGRVKEYKIIVPTMFNIPVIERTLKGVPVEIADVVPRIYDPCIPCSTHLVRVRD